MQGYTTLMNHQNCLAAVTVCSGGGQLTQYFCNNNVLYYNKKLYMVATAKFDFWDQTTISSVNRYYFKDLEELCYIFSLSDNIEIFRNNYNLLENTRLILNMNIFDWNFYINYHQDLLHNGINNKELAEIHYIKHGYSENRICNQ